MSLAPHNINSVPIPEVEAVRGQLDKIVASRHFQGSGMLCEFLRHIVEYSLRGEQQRLKEYQLGMEVFGRTSSYDPRFDPVVRQTARRLRAKLQTYYALEGCYDPIRIDVPKGSYAATFAANDSPTVPRSSEASTLNSPIQSKPTTIEGRTGLGKHPAALTVTAILLAIVIGLAIYTDIARRQDLPFHYISIQKMSATGDSTVASLSSDGKYLVNVISDAGMESLRLHHLPTTSTTELIPPAAVHYIGLRFSRDNSYIYFVRGEASNQVTHFLYRMPILGGQAAKLVTDIDTNITFSPDGRKFAYLVYNSPQNNQYRLVVQALDRGEETTISSGPDEMALADPSWSPDGKTIVCSMAHPGEMRSGLVAVDVASGERRIFFRSKALLVSHAAWLPDGHGLLLLASDQPNFTHQQIGFVSYPEGRFQPVTRDTGNYTDLSLTADGRTAAAVLRDARWKLTLLAQDLYPGRVEQQIAPGAAVEGFTWTSNEEMVVNQEYMLSLLNLASGRERTIAGGEGSAPAHPSACNSAPYFVFDNSPPDGLGKRNVWRMATTDSRATQLTYGKLDVYPYCSSDGHWVFYEGADLKLWKVPTQGGDPQAVSQQMVSGCSTCVRPFDVSPDGKWIAFGSFLTDDPDEKLVIVHNDSGGSSKLFKFQQARQGASLRFTPDGNAVVYPIRKNGADNLWRQPLDDSPGQQITDFQSEQIRDFQWSFDGKQLALLRGHIDSDVILIQAAAR